MLFYCTWITTLSKEKYYNIFFHPYLFNHETSSLQYTTILITHTRIYTKENTSGTQLDNTNTFLARSRRGSLRYYGWGMGVEAVPYWPEHQHGHHQYWDGWWSVNINLMQCLGTCRRHRCCTATCWTPVSVVWLTQVCKKSYLLCCYDEARRVSGMDETSRMLPRRWGMESEYGSL